MRLYADNNVPSPRAFHEKIAEARIAYGGRGRMTEIQQPGWGLQLFDILSPF